jgi:hypothetical protein
MADEVTICAKCAWLHGDAKGKPWWSWMCAAAPLETINPVCGRIDPPFMLCRFVNHGRCHMYAEGPNVISPKETADA